MYIIKYLKRIHLLFKFKSITNELIKTEIYLSELLKSLGFYTNNFYNIFIFGEVATYVEYIKMNVLCRGSSLYNLITYNNKLNKILYLNEPDNKIAFIVLRNINTLACRVRIEANEDKYIAISINGEIHKLIDEDLNDIAILLTIYIKDDFDTVKIRYITFSFYDFYEKVKIFSKIDNQLVLKHIETNTIDHTIINDPDLRKNYEVTYRQIKGV